MRATRAYLAGFGTAGSLLAGAAFLFVIAGAFVSFNGWPDIAQRPGPAAAMVASIGPRPHVTPTRIVPAVLTKIAAPGPAAAAAGTPGGGTNVGRVISLQPGGVGVGLVGSHATASPPPPVISKIIKPTLPVPPSVIVTKATGTLGSAVSSTGSSLSAGTTSATGSLGATIAKINPQLGQTVSSAGAAVSGAVSSTTAALGTLLSGGGKKITTVLDGH